MKLTYLETKVLAYRPHYHDTVLVFDKEIRCPFGILYNHQYGWFVMLLHIRPQWGHGEIRLVVYMVLKNICCPSDTYASGKWAIVSLYRCINNENRKLWVAWCQLTERWLDANFVVTGGTGGCRYENLKTPGAASDDEVGMTMMTTLDIQWLACHRLYPDSKVHGANMGPTCVLSAPDGPHVGPMNLAIMIFCPGSYTDLLNQMSNKV